MRRLKQKGLTSEKIMLHLKLDRTNYDYHMSQIYKEDRKQLRNVRNNLIEHELLIAKGRLERSIEVCEEISRNSEHQPDERINAEKLKQETSMNIVRLLVDGPKILGIDQSNDNTGNINVSDDESKSITTAMDKLFTTTTNQE